LNQTSFSSLGLAPALLRALDDLGFTQPTPIQEQAIPALLQGSDLLGLAQTGTGKTAAFALPLLQRLGNERAAPRRPRPLVLAPTRELAAQIASDCSELGRHMNVRHAVIFGGVNARPQIQRMASGVELVIATPGRLLDLIGQRHIDLGALEILVLDEADRLLDMGFIADIRRIVGYTPDDRQSLLFSATMPAAVSQLANRILERPVRVDVSPAEPTVRAIDQRVMHVAGAEKQRVLEQLLDHRDVTRAIVFTRTKHHANRVAQKLESAGICAEAIHGNKSQGARQRALQNFRDGSARVLVATDIAARGIDIENVSHVVNFELPHEPEAYVHRIGRTGRAGASGIAWSLVDPTERDRLRAITRLIGFDLKPIAAMANTNGRQSAPVRRSRRDETRSRSPRASRPPPRRSPRRRPGDREADVSRRRRPCACAP
jgi:ATP-dependent RNA helicase RhlE